MTDLTHYVDLRYRPNPEIPGHEVLSEAMNCLHVTLVGQPDLAVAVSFPGHKRREFTLGDVLRLHGNARDLEAGLEGMMSMEGGLGDVLHASDVKVVPEKTQGYWRVLRRQYKTNVDKERRRYCRRLGVSWEEACNKLPATSGAKVTLPYLWLRSRSTGQQFTLHLDHRWQREPNLGGGFNRYGLSTGGVVPAFD